MPLGVRVAVPLIGLVLAALILRVPGRGATPSTADEYIKNFHDPGHALDVRPLPARLAASVATIGFGGAMGFEGPSMKHRSPASCSPSRCRTRTTSRAPMLLPAGTASAASYVTLVALTDTEPFFRVAGSPPFDLRDLGGAALLGILASIGARLLVTTVVWGKAFRPGWHPLVRAISGGIVLVAVALLARWVFGDPLTLGAGYDNIAWALDPDHTLVLVLLLFGLRWIATVATVATVAGGGVGGLFIPLVVHGALPGRVVNDLVNTPAGATTTRFPLVGVAAFLGVGYRVAAAGVVFAAEATGRPGFIVPGLIVPGLIAPSSPSSSWAGRRCPVPDRRAKRAPGTARRATAERRPADR